MTTPVGSISLGLSIDGSGLPADILREISTALEPTLAKLNRELDQLQRKLDQTGRAAEKSGAKQAAAAKVAADAVEDIGDEAAKTAAKTTTAAKATTRALDQIGGGYSRSAAKALASSKVQTAAIDSVTRALGEQTAAGKAAMAAMSTRQINLVTAAVNRQANAWQRLAKAQTAAAAAPQPNTPPPGGGGSGGRGGRGGGFFGMGGPVAGAVGWNAVAAGIGSFPSAATAVTNLVGAVQQLGQAGLALPGVIGGIASSVGTLKLGLAGVKDGFEAAWEAAASGDPKDIEKAAEAMKNLAPAAQSAVKAVVGLRPEWERLQRDVVQQNMFDGLDKTITDLAGKSMPTLEKGLGGIATAWNNTFKELGRVGGLDSTQGFLDKLFGNTSKAQTNLNKAIEPLVHGLGTLTSESSDFLPRLADGLKGVTTRFDNWITTSTQNGNLDKWINQGIDAAKNFGEAFLNVGKIITDITKAAGGDGGFLKWLNDATTKLHAFLSSDAGQTKLKEFFRDGREQLKKWGDILVNLGPILVGAYNGFKQWTDVLLPVLQGITGVLSEMPGGITGVVTAFLAWKTISGAAGILGLITNLGKVGGLLDGISGKLGSKGGGGVLGKLGMLGAVLALPAVIDAVKDISSGQAQKPDAGRSAALIGGGAAIGAQYGGVPGAFIGAGIGTAVAVAPVLANGAYVDPNAAQRQGTLPTPNSLGPGFRPGDRGGLTPRDPGYGAELQRQADLQAATDAGQRARNGVPPVAPDVLKSIQDATAEARDAGTEVEALGGAIKALPTGEVQIKDETPEAIDRLKKLGLAVQQLPDGHMAVRVQFTDPNGNPIDPSTFRTPARMPAFPGDTTVPKGGRAEGGVFPGYAPGVDSILSWVSPGEGVLIPEAVRGLGGAAAVYAINSRFRSGLSRRGYADGGVVGGAPGVDDATELGVLRQIRDLLAGKGGTSAPLNQTADAVSNLAGTSGRGGQQTGPFGTPLKKRGDPGYEMAAAAISALGGDPEKWIGADPSTYMPAVAGGGSVLAGGADYGNYAAVLGAFARTGNLTGDLGLDANDPVVKAITTARNKKKGALGGDTIAGLVDQVLTGGGYTGTLDSSNSSLISTLQTFREKLAKPSKGGRGTAVTASLTGVPTYGLGMDPVSAYAQQFSGGQYSWGSSDLAKGLSDCSGAVSDLVELITKGQAGPERLFSTSDAASVLKSLGAVQGSVPGALQIGWSDSHMRATLPNGVNFESGGGTGQGATYGGNAQGAAGMPNIMSLPVNGAVPGMAGLAGATGGAGTPVFVTNWPGGQGLPPGVGQVLGAGLTAGGQATSGVAGDVMSAVGGLGQEPWNKATNYATLNALVKERNPMALAKAFGLDVPDFTRQGGDGADVMKNDQAFDSSGRMFSDTGALLDRTFTNLNAQLDAMRKQLVDVIEQTNQKLNEEALQPVVKAGVQSALEGLKDSVTSSIGTSMGQAAAPPIADAVRSAIPSQTGAGGLAGDAVNGVKAATGMATGGPVFGGVRGRDSVPTMLMPDEHVFTTADVAAMGGHAGVYAFRAALHRSGGVRGMATGGGVNVNDTVGAEFFGVSQIPIIGAIVNILVRVLLSVLGVQIEARDTLGEMTDQFRQFRGDFKGFDASGRLLNDTSALMDRSQSSEEIAAQERIRILKIVIQALIKYIIEKVIVPIGKAVANAAINAGASAAGAAVNTQAPGAGSIVQSLISSAGSAGVDIVAEVGTDLALAVSEVAIDAISEGLQGLFPDLMTGLFGGGILEQLLVAPIQAALEIPLAMIGALTGGLGALFAPLAALVGGIAFDSGGVASGVGLMAKATIAPERVLSPNQTVLFERMVSALERGQTTAAGQTLVQAEIHVAGGPDAGRDVRDGLLELMS
ncbi:hypothetical protein [Mycobacterium sp. DL440]|uniref:hypothetical protein n=1 Tax=Mycobacterium sp. DL440 TaxID=2675523 RepID=UPI0014230D79|nr:hypothetical protein [Mycobacterium sp. DL440]